MALSECECIIHDAHSLKEKRAVLQRILTRLKQKFNVSVAETDYQDLWQRTKIAIVAVSSSQKVRLSENYKMPLNFLILFRN